MIRISVNKLLDNPESPLGLNELIDLVDSVLKDDDFINLNVSDSDSQHSMDLESDGSFPIGPRDSHFLAHEPNLVGAQNEEKSSSLLFPGEALLRETKEKRLSCIPAPRRVISLQPKYSNKKNFVPNFEAGFEQMPTEEVLFLFSLLLSAE